MQEQFSVALATYEEKEGDGDAELQVNAAQE